MFDIRCRSGVVDVLLVGWIMRTGARDDRDGCVGMG